MSLLVYLYASFVILRNCDIWFQLIVILHVINKLHTNFKAGINYNYTNYVSSITVTSFQSVIVIEIYFVIGPSSVKLHLLINVCCTQQLDTAMCKSNSTIHDNNYILSKGSYTAQYPILRIAQSTLLPWQTCSLRHHLNFSGKHRATCYN